jgi:hypothetical protein
MTRVSVLCAVILAGARVAEGHALDEYIQALRVGIEPACLSLSLDLTPGVKVAAEIVRRIDGNGDGRFSPAEAETYGRAVIADLALSVDGDAVPLSLLRVEIPLAGELREGQGTIRLQVSAPSTTGLHRLVVRNGHMPAQSVYLANALLPDTPAVRIVRQSRDVRQQTFFLDYEVRRVRAAGLVWVLIGGAMLTTLARARSHGGSLRKFLTEVPDVGARRFRT